MGRLLGVVSCGLLVMSLVGCVTTPTARVAPGVGVAALPVYHGPKARISVADFDVKAAQATGEIGSGLRDMLITSLINSNRFIVMERQVLDAVMRERELAAAALGEDEPQRGRIEAADLIITAAVTEFEPRATGVGGGIGGGGIVGDILGAAVGGALNRAHLALDIRIVDATTAQVLAATRVEGEASDISGAIMGAFFGSFAAGGALSAYANTPMEKAIRVCIEEAVRYISLNTPADFFRY